MSGPTPFKTLATTSQHQKTRLDVLDVLRRDLGDRDGMEMIAVLSYTLGQMIAMQDQRKYTPPMVMELVAKNIELGNADVLENLARTGGTKQ